MLPKFIDAPGTSILSIIIYFVLLCVGYATVNLLIIIIDDNLSLMFIKLY